MARRHQGRPRRVSRTGRRSSASRHVRRRSAAYKEPVARAPRVKRARAVAARRGYRAPRSSRVLNPEKVLKMQAVLAKSRSRPAGTVLPASKRERVFRHFRAALAGRAHAAPFRRRAYHRRRS